MDTLSPAVTAALRAVRSDRQHPGLLLDKLQAPPDDMKSQKSGLQSVANAKGDPALLAGLLKRRKVALGALGARIFSARAAAPLTLHLARSGPFENAGLCLNPVHGFAWLPASGLKGLARAYAETRWLEDQADQAEAWRKIGAVFGRIKETDKGKSWAPEVPFEETGSGQVVFHDAWPETWPSLFVDIANNHHPEYYQKDGVAHGDWENPVPIYFLAVEAGVNFSFAVSPRKATEEGLLTLAAQWLEGALVHAGAGAKTAAGYGVFELVDRPTPTPSGKRLRFEAALELVTPAFLAGANQALEDCGLRPATLRGQLRWWWRTMHAGHLDIRTLKKLEAAVWGDTEQGSPLRVTVTPTAPLKPRLFNSREVTRENNLPQGHDRRTIMGLDYGSYGMTSTRDKPARYYLPERSKWTVTIAAAAGRIGARQGKNAMMVDAADVLKQAQAALWLLCCFGGVGSKSRNGYGCFSDVAVPGIAGIEDCKRLASEWRGRLGLNRTGGTAAPDSPDLDTAILVEVPLNTNSAFGATHEVGRMMQNFRKNGGLKSSERAILGLPGKNRDKGPKGSRHAAAAHLHVTRDGNRYVLRVTAFPVSTLLWNDGKAEHATSLLKRLVDFYRGAPAKGVPERTPPHRAQEQELGRHPPTSGPAAPQSLVGRRGTYDGEGCTVLTDNGEKLGVRFDNGGDIEDIRRSEFEPE